MTAVHLPIFKRKLHCLCLLYTTTFPYENCFEESSIARKVKVEYKNTHVDKRVKVSKPAVAVSPQ